MMQKRRNMEKRSKEEKKKYNKWKIWEQYVS